MCRNTPAERGILLLYKNFIERDNNKIDKTAMNKLLNSNMEKILEKHGLLK